MTAAGRNNADTFEYFRPGFDLERERQLREESGCGEQIEEKDLYPDVRPALSALRDAGVWVGVAGNQTARAEQLLRGLDLPVDRVVTSGEWGVAKPQAEFFERVVQMAPGRADQIVYVGDHRDIDVIPAKAAGLRVAWIRRGPWGYLWSDDPVARRSADWVIDSLDELSDLVAS